MMASSDSWLRGRPRPARLTAPAERAAVVGPREATREAARGAPREIPTEEGVFRRDAGREGAARRVLRAETFVFMTAARSSILIRGRHDGRFRASGKT